MEYIEKQLSLGGYEEIAAKGMSCRIWISRKYEGLGVCVFGDQEALLQKPLEIDTILYYVEEALSRKLSLSFRMLALIVAEDLTAAAALSHGEHPRWFMNEERGLVIFEGQPGEFGRLETILTHPVTLRSRVRSTFGQLDYKRLPWATLILIFVNVAVQIVVAVQEGTAGGNSRLMSAMVLDIMEYHLNPEYWRLLSSAFLHFGWTHLFNNMLALLFLGSAAESEIGRFRFTASYFICAVGANLASVWWYVSQGELSVMTAGASGAVFGVVGLLLFYVMVHRGRLGNITGRRLVFMLVLTLYNGMTDGGVNNCAHAAGALLGFLCGMLLYFPGGRKCQPQRS